MEKLGLANQLTGTILFIAYFALYGLEYFIPLVPKRSNHFKTNISLALVLVTVNLFFTSSTLLTSNWVVENKIGLFQHVSISVVWQVLLSICLLDFWSGYLGHLIFHKSAWLWQLHIVHHTDELVDVTTSFRQHPMESIIKILFNLSGMILLGIPSWILLIYLTMSTINSQLEHANIRVSEKVDRILQLIFVTPNMHKIHHSKHQPETDSNYSNIFSFWDRLFRTYKSRKDYTTIPYGLDYLTHNHSLTFWDLLRLPFIRTNNVRGKDNETQSNS